MPIWARAAWILNSPRLGFVYKRRIASIALSVTCLTPGGLAWGLASSPRGAPLGPALEDPVDGGGTDLKVAGDGLGAPAVRVQRHHRRPAISPFGDVVEAREALHEPQGYGFFVEDAPHRLVVGAPAEADVDGVRYLV